ncbi:MAG: citrate lyase holo-[acyl-carrier protein] synthase [Spirochaetales bacterium]|nr:citrate lyase holo-[acyl-carrier protein] synthase [Spirochaetales bacterium]
MQTEILAAREERADRTRRFIARLRLPVIVLTINVPGSDKNEPWVADALTQGRHAVEAELETRGWVVQAAQGCDSAAGPEWRATIADGSDLENVPSRDTGRRPISFGVEIKRMTVYIEEAHPIGRLLDIDVFDDDLTSIGRSDLGLPPRRCLICDNPAHECARSRQHAPAQLRSKIAELMMREPTLRRRAFL